MIHMLRRRVLTGAAAAVGACMSIGIRAAWAAAPEVGFDFAKPLEGWTTVSGKWAIEDVPPEADPLSYRLAKSRRLLVPNFRRSSTAARENTRRSDDR